MNDTQASGDFLGLLGINTRCGTTVEKLPQPFVLKTLDHLAGSQVLRDANHYS
ncbi:hypothetical protein D3C84_1067830 [compost metagenome]